MPWPIVLGCCTGELVETGPTSEVLLAPRERYTQRLLASLPVPEPAEQADRRELARALRKRNPPYRVTHKARSTRTRTPGSEAEKFGIDLGVFCGYDRTFANL